MELKNRFSCLSVDNQDGESRHEDEGAAVHEKKVEKWKKIKDQRKLKQNSSRCAWLQGKEK